ncbi:MAG TPA: tetratricopeptide repeat protein [Kofleriaceae bacterium]|jgi:tetratricopeptide (TPR) repeat protein|nr:tetratricopeptide repeat protein [Kofleriaceae bacterium]
MSATSWYDTGCRLEATDPARAIAAYERALTSCPDLADAHNNLGRLLHDARSPAVAEGHYRLAICADPGVALYWFNLGVSVEDQGRCAEAIAAYARAIEIDEHVADAHFNLARLLELTARRAGDEMMLRRAVRHLLRYRALTKRNTGAR